MTSPQEFNLVVGLRREDGSLQAARVVVLGDFLYVFEKLEEECWSAKIYLHSSLNIEQRDARLLVQADSNVSYEFSFEDQDALARLKNHLENGVKDFILEHNVEMLKEFQSQTELNSLLESDQTNRGLTSGDTSAQNSLIHLEAVLSLLTIDILKEEKIESFIGRSKSTLPEDSSNRKGGALEFSFKLTEVSLIRRIVLHES